MSNTHHPHGPSTLQNKAVCCGWINDPTSDTTLADEGTLMHAATEMRRTDHLTTEQKGWVDKCITYVDRLENMAGVTGVQREVFLTIRGVTYGTSDHLVQKVRLDGKKHLFITDLKFAWNQYPDAEVNLQGWAYTLGSDEFYPGADYFTVTFLYPKLDIVSKHTFSRADLPRLELAVRTIVARAEHFAKTGDETMLNPTIEGCLHCGRKATCGRLTSLALATAKKYAPLEVVDNPHSSEVTIPHKMAQLVAIAPILEKMAGSIKEHAKAFAANNGGIHDESGKLVYELVTKEAPRKLNPNKVADVVDILVREGLTEREILACSDLSITQALDLIADKAGKGQKAKRRGAVEGMLQEIDGITRGEPSLVLKKVKNKD